MLVVVVIARPIATRLITKSGQKVWRRHESREKEKEKEREFLLVAGKISLSSTTTPRSGWK